MKKLYLALLLAGSLTTAFAQDHPGMKTMDLTAAQMAHYMAPGWNLGNTLELLQQFHSRRRYRLRNSVATDQDHAAGP